MIDGARDGDWGRWTRVVFMLVAVAFAVGRVMSQDGGDSASAGGDGVPELFGLSVGSIVWAVLLVVAWMIVSTAIGARMAGLESVVGKSMVTVILAVVLTVVLDMLLASGVGGLSAKTRTIIGQLLHAVIEISIIRRIFHVEWQRAILIYLLASVLTLVGASVLLIAMF